MDRTEILFNDDWKVVRIDSMNWQVQNRREIGKGKPGTESREGCVDWVALPAYFGSVAAAAGYVFDHIGDKVGKKTAKEFSEFMAKEREKLVKAVKKAVA